MDEVTIIGHAYLKLRPLVLPYVTVSIPRLAEIRTYSQPRIGTDTRVISITPRVEVQKRGIDVVTRRDDGWI